jgi:hypothetical protein
MAKFTLESLDATPNEVGTGEDVLRSTGAGLRRGVESIAGTPQDLATLAAIGSAWLAGKLGAKPETQESIRGMGEIPILPSSDEIHGVTDKIIGKSYEPQTDAGRFASGAAEFAGGAIGPGGLIKGGIKHAAKQWGAGAVAGLASEAAGQATEGTALEPWARAAAGVGGGAGVSAVDAGVTHLATKGAREAEIAAEDAAKRGAPDIQLTKGQRSGDVAQQQKEQQMLHGARGSWAQRLLVARDEENKRAIMEAGTGLLDQTAPTRGASPVDSAGLLNSQTQARADTLRKTGGEQIQKALEGGVMLDADRLRGLPGELSGKLEGDTPYVPDVILDSTTPVASQAMERVKKFVSAAGDPNVKEVSMAGAEQLRRVLGKLEGDTDTDRRALAKVRQYFDDWYDTSINDHARVMPDPTALPGPGGTRDPRDILADLKSGRATSKEGLDIVKPRGDPQGGKTVADIGSGKRSAEETARLFKPNDRGNLSVQAIDAIERLTQLKAPSTDLDQIRAIVLDQLKGGDPGKVATRIDNFVRDNPTAAAALFTPEQLQQMKDFGSTNKKLVPDPKATNPSKSSYGIIGEAAKKAGNAMAGTGGLIGATVGGLPGMMLGAAGGKAIEWAEGLANKRGVKEALSPANRDALTETMLKGTGPGAKAAARGAVQAGQKMTIDDPGQEYDGQTGRVIKIGENMVILRMPDGKEKQVGKALLKPGD